MKLARNPLTASPIETLVEAIRATGHENAYSVSGRDMVAQFLVRLVRPGDLVLCLGAGDISQWAHALPGELEAAQPVQTEAQV